MATKTTDDAKDDGKAAQTASASGGDLTEKQAKEVLDDYHKTGTVRKGFVIDYRAPGNVRRKG